VAKATRCSGRGRGRTWIEAHFHPTPPELLGRGVLFGRLAPETAFSSKRRLIVHREAGLIERT
jgi:hypothetical protein